MDIGPPYVSKHNSNREKQVILLSMIPNRKVWHCLAVKKLSALLRGVILVIFILWIFFILLEQKPNLNHIKKYVKIKIFVKCYAF